VGLLRPSLLHAANRIPAIATYDTETIENFLKPFVDGVQI